MSFSASTCITNTGTTELGPTLLFYSDVTGFGTSFGSDSTENLIGDNWPYIMENIPDGTILIIPFPLTASLQDYKAALDTYIFYYGR